MSDTDDTDDLLQVPSDIFVALIEENIGIDPLASVELVDNLITQVSDLENRVSIIESINSPFESVNSPFREHHSLSPMVLNEFETSLEGSMNDEELQTNVKVSETSLTSPPLALITSSLNSNTESSQDLTTICNLDSPKSKESLLKEIDTYLSNISNNNSKLEEGKMKSGISLIKSKEDTNRDEGIADSIIRRDSPDERLDLPAVDRLLREMEATHLEIETKLHMREIEYGLQKNRTTNNAVHRKSFPPGRNLPCSRSSFDIDTSPLKSSNEFEKHGNIEEFAGKRDHYLVGSSHNSDSDDARKNAVLLKSVRADPTRTSLENRRRFISPRRRIFSTPDSYTNRKMTTAYTKEMEHGKSHTSHFGVGDGPQSPNKFAESDQNDRLLRNQCNRNNLLSLADLWKSERDLSDDDVKKLRQKLEEEKLRRIHLENTIQDLQKRVLEEQEKLAVAVKVDEGKDKAIAQITGAWKQMVNHWREIEADRHAMSQAIIKERAAMKQAQEEINKKVERWEKEVSQALDLAAGYKSKCEFLETELLVTKEANEEKASELEKKIKSVEEELQILNEERKSLTEKLNISEEEHNKEKKLVEIAQKELSTLQEIHKKTEGELSIVTEQRDLLSTRLRDERGRINILEQQKASLQTSLGEAEQKLAEAEETVKNLTMNLEKTKTELRGVYQNQLEAVVKEKLEEFQSQLDQAQMAMKAEVNEAKRQAQERATLQQQALVNSHVIELRRLETMHKEEIKILEAKLEQSEKQREKLESGKKEIAHRLHGVMEAQWQQALSIITSEISMKQGEGDLKKKDESFEEQNHKSAAVKNVEEALFSKDGHQPENRRHSKHDTLLKYIQMLLDKQPGRPIDSSSSGLWPDITQSDVLDESISLEPRWNQLISGGNQCQAAPVPSQSKQLFHLKKPPWK